MALLFAIHAVSPNNAAANTIEDMVGVGGRSKALGGAGTASTTDHGATYYNVANLAFGPESSISLAYGRIDYGLYVHGDSSDPEKEPLRPRDNITLGISQQLPMNFSMGALLNLGPGGSHYSGESSGSPAYFQAPA